MMNKDRACLEKFQHYDVPSDVMPARRVVGIAVAGFASPATEMLDDSITIDEYLVEHPASTVLVKVSGESMIGAGIHAGDMLVVERNANPNIDTIVVAMVDGEFTIKHLRKDAQGIYLEPANDNFSIIRPEQGLEIYGEMVGLFRKTK